jgi:nitrogen fixation/metabolism regulation signal transduction histidine kinase
MRINIKTEILISDMKHLINYTFKLIFMKFILLLAVILIVAAIIVHLFFLYFGNRSRIRFVNNQIKSLIKAIINALQHK